MNTGNKAMTIKELLSRIAMTDVSPNAQLRIIQEEELECMPGLWNDEEHKVGGTSGAIELYSEDCHSHKMYLLAV